MSYICEEREDLISDVAQISIPSDSFVLFRTARIERFAYGEKEYFDNHPQLSHEFTVYTMWLEDTAMTGLKCRAIAEIY